MKKFLNFFQAARYNEAILEKHKAMLIDSFDSFIR